MPGVVCASVALWLTLPSALVSLVWASMAILLVDLFRRFRIPVLTHTATGLAAIAYGRGMFTDLANTNRIWSILVRFVSIALFIALLYWMSNRLASAGHRTLGLFASWLALGPFLAVTLLEARTANVAAYWIAGSLALLIYSTLVTTSTFAFSAIASPARA